MTLTAQQPENNTVRTTIQALAAVLGGTQSLHVNSWDEALALPTEESVQLSLRTQQIIAHESGVTDTVDPLAGSYFIESLTDQLEEKAFRYIDEIDNMGGALAALDKGYQVQEIHESAFKLQRAVEAQDQIVVGVNRYQTEEPPIRQLQKINPGETKRQLDRLARVKRERDEAATEASLRRLEEGCAVGRQHNAGDSRMRRGLRDGGRDLRCPSRRLRRAGRVHAVLRSGLMAEESICIARHINHVALVVNDMDETLEFYRRVFGVRSAVTEEVPDQGVRAAVVRIGGSLLELIQPTDPDGGVAKFIERRGEGMHHICFEVDDLRGHVGSPGRRRRAARRQGPTSRSGGGHRVLASKIHPRRADRVGGRRWSDEVEEWHRSRSKYW